MARAEHAHHGMFVDAPYRSPGLAAVLSLTPVPVDFGNLYAENVGWGIVYTAAELSLTTPMMWLMGGHMGHANDAPRSWSAGERNGMIAFMSSYMVVKLAAAIHAGYAAADFNRGADAAATVVPLKSGAMAWLEQQF